MADTGIVSSQTVDWRSDHGILEAEILGLPLIRSMFRQVYQRPLKNIGDVTDKE